MAFPKATKPDILEKKILALRDEHNSRAHELHEHYQNKVNKLEKLYEAAVEKAKNNTGSAAIRHEPRRRGPSRWLDDMIIHVLTPGNPKMPGTLAHYNFSQYANGMTVKEFVDRLGGRSKATSVLDRDYLRGLISITAKSAYASGNELSGLMTGGQDNIATSQTDEIINSAAE